MFDESEPQSPETSTYALAPVDPGWRPILHASNQVVLYHPTSHALAIREHRTASTPNTVARHHSNHRCPLCHRSWPADDVSDEEEAELELLDSELEDHPRSRVPNYFQLLQISNESTSVPPTPTSHTNRIPSPEPAASSSNGQAFRANNMAEGYFEAFFQEECRLGMGANGSVYLCQHVLDGNPLGHFAVKKIAVGQSHSYLLNILREVRLLEQLHHPNIIQYHHSWLETSQFSSFGPKVPTLHVLMQWAEGGSLDDFIDVRLGRASSASFAHLHPGSRPASGAATPQSSQGNPLSRSARIRAFRAMQHASPEERERLRREAVGEMPANVRQDNDWKAVHLLSAEEVKSIFKDVVEGLAFLHDKSILHLDLKPGNVLLTWDQGKLIPRAMLSDFGTSQDKLTSRTRSGNTGTLEYAAPESLPSPTGALAEIDSKSDMWSLGMILYKLLFFRLPYKHASDSPEKADSRLDGKDIMDLLEKEVSSYTGFKSTQTLSTNFASRRLPTAYLVLLENLLHINPSVRPSSERVLGAIREGRLDPVPVRPRTRNGLSSLIPILRRTSNENRAESSTGVRTGAETPTELPVWTDNDGKDDDAPSSVREPFLRLPAPSGLDDAPHDPEYAKLRLWSQEYRLTRSTAKLALKRTIKSALLVLKVRSLSAMYGDPLVNRDIITCAMVLAFTDTWSEQLTMSVALGFAHLGLVRLSHFLR